MVKFFAPTPVANGEEGVHFTTNRRGITFTLATAYLVTVTVTPTDALTPTITPTLTLNLTLTLTLTLQGLPPPT